MKSMGFTHSDLHKELCPAAAGKTRGAPGQGVMSRGSGGRSMDLPPVMTHVLPGFVPAVSVSLIIREKELIPPKLPNMLKGGGVPSNTPILCSERLGLLLWTSHFLRDTKTKNKKVVAKRGLLKSLTPLSPNLFSH